jgi:predicted secreted protein
MLQRGDGASPEVFTTIAEVTTIKATGSKADVIDVTNMDSPSAFREKLVTLLDAGEISFDGNFVSDDPTQANVEADFEGRALHNWKIVLPTDPLTSLPRGHWAFAAYVTGVDFDLQHDKQSTMSVKLTVSGPKPYTSGS